MDKDDDEPAVRLPNVNAAILAKVNTIVYIIDSAFVCFLFSLQAT